MKRNFSWMKAQQAPAPRQAWLFGAVHTASNKAQRMTGGIVTAKKATASKVRPELKTLLNRLARNQPMRPAAAGGGGSTTTGSSCVTSVIACRHIDGAGNRARSRHTGEGRCPFETWVPACAGTTGHISHRSSARLPLHQRDGAVVEVHQQRDDQADRQVDRHDH